MDANVIAARIEKSLGTAEVTVRDLTGTGDHFEARVVSPAFEGKSMVEQHQLVYAGLDDVLKTGELHALALRTFTPAAWDKAKEK